MATKNTKNTPATKNTPNTKHDTPKFSAPVRNGNKVVARALIPATDFTDAATGANVLHMLNTKNTDGPDFAGVAGAWACFRSAEAAALYIERGRALIVGLSNVQTARAGYADEAAAMAEAEAAARAYFEIVAVNADNPAKPAEKLPDARAFVESALTRVKVSDVKNTARTARVESGHISDSVGFKAIEKALLAGIRDGLVMTAEDYAIRAATNKAATAANNAAAAFVDAILSTENYAAIYKNIPDTDAARAPEKNAALKAYERAQKAEAAAAVRYKARIDTLAAALVSAEKISCNARILEYVPAPNKPHFISVRIGADSKPYAEAPDALSLKEYARKARAAEAEKAVAEKAEAPAA